MAPCILFCLEQEIHEHKISILSYFLLTTTKICKITHLFFFFLHNDTQYTYSWIIVWFSLFIVCKGSESKRISQWLCFCCNGKTARPPRLQEVLCFLFVFLQGQIVFAASFPSNSPDTIKTLLDRNAFAEQTNFSMLATWSSRLQFKEPPLGFVGALTVPAAGLMWKNAWF